MKKNAMHIPDRSKAFVPEVNVNRTYRSRIKTF